MSAKKTGRDHSAVSTPEPAAALLVAQEVRRLLCFHLALGLDVYPADQRVRSFIDSRTGGRRATSPLPAYRSRQRPGPPSGAQSMVSCQPADAALEELRSAVQACSLCGLSKNGPDRIRGKGTDSPRLLVVGDWTLPDKSGGTLIFGRGEDEMLARMMAAIGLDRGDYHVTNVLKCAFAGSRPPADAVMSCRTWLKREIAILRPRLICAMGGLATQVLADSSQPLARVHGRLLGCRCASNRTPQVLPTYHPRLLLGQPELKQVAWQDLRKLARYLARSGDRN